MQKLSPLMNFRETSTKAWRQFVAFLICSIGALPMWAERITYTPEQIIQKFNIDADGGEFICKLGTDPVSGKPALVFAGFGGYVTITGTRNYNSVQSITLEGSSSADGSETLSQAVLIERVEINGNSYYNELDEKAACFYPSGSYDYVANTTSGSLYIYFYKGSSTTFYLTSLSVDCAEQRKISFDPATVTIKQGEKVELPDMVGDTDGIISDSTSYSIDNPAIAAFNCAEGNRSMILGEKPGETTLFAHVNATKNLPAGVAKLHITVTPAEVEGDVVTIQLTEAGTLREKLAELEDVTSISRLKLVGPINSQDLALLRAGTGRLAKLVDIDLADVTLVPDGGAYSTVETDRYKIGLGTETTTYYLSDEERTEESSSSTGLGGSNHYVKEYTLDLGGAFANMTQLQRIVLPTSLTRVGDHFALNCNKLVSVTSQGKITEVEEDAFYGCEKLVEHPFDGVERIGSGAFQRAAIGLIDLSQLKELGSAAFNESCVSHANLVSLDSIAADAFRESYISQLVLSDSLKYIGEGAFANTAMLRGNLALPKHLSEIGSAAFMRSHIQQVTSAPDKLTRAGFNIMYGTEWYWQHAQTDSIIMLGSAAIELGSSCKSGNLTSITLPAGTTVISDQLFYGCDKLQHVSLPASLLAIGNKAFASCTSLTTCTLPKQLQYIGNQAFSWTALSTVNLDGNMTIGESAFNNISTLLRVNYNVPNAATAQNMFASCKGLEIVNIGADVTILPAYMFTKCNSLLKVNFAERPDYTPLVIEDEVFNGCNLLSKAELPMQTTHIGRYAFGATALTQVTLPKTLTYLHSSAFNNGKIATIYNYMRRPYDFSSELSGNVAVTPFATETGRYILPDWFGADVTVYVRPESVEAYQADLAWGKCNIQPMDAEHMAVGINAVRQNNYTPAIHYGADGRTLSLADGRTFSVFTLDGRSVAKYVTTCSIALPGTYIIVTDNSTAKVIVH